MNADLKDIIKTAIAFIIITIFYLFLIYKFKLS